MEPHTVRTARGGVINMAELRVKSKQPMVDMGDQKDKVEPQKMPDRQINIVGFMPSMNGVAQPVQPEYIPRLAEQEQPQPVYEDAPTLADMTGVIVEQPKHLKEKPADPAGAANQALREIMGDLEQYKGREVEKSKPSRRK